MKSASHAVPSRSARRQGVVLLVMLSLLALFTVIAVTFVVASGHFRRSATAFSKAEQYGDPFDVLLQQALMQIVRGSNNPQSVIGPHSLLEDMYGQADAVVGRLESADEIVGDNTAGSSIMRDWALVRDGRSGMMLKLNAGLSYGWDKKPGRANEDDGGNGIVDDASEGGAAGSDDVYVGNTPAYPDPARTQSNPQLPGNAFVSNAQIVDNVDNYYAGRVITFISGAAAGQSCYILRSKVVGTQPGSLQSPTGRTILYVTPPENGITPFAGTPTLGNGDRYVINSRAFNGTGIGSAMPNYPRPKKPADLRLLSTPYQTAASLDSAVYPMSGKMPIALTLNPVDAGYRQYLKDFAAIVDPDEDYDAHDYQNPMLAHRQGTGKTLAPSLHRPDLVNYYLKLPVDSSGKNLLGYTPDIRWTSIPPAIRRRIILRPDPADHYDYTQGGFSRAEDDGNGFQAGEPFTDANNNNVWDPGEQFTDQNNNNYYDPGDRVFANSGFDAINGPWDVDNDGDGYPDSIWVDVGLPVQTGPDGRMIKPLVAIMVLDMDGRINVNAHGSPKHYFRTTELAEVVPDVTDAGGKWAFSPPVNRIKPHPRQTTEERYLAGAKAIAYDQADGETNLNLMTDTLFTSGIFNEYHETNARWATGVENYPSGGTPDWHAMWSSLPKVYTDLARNGFENREMGPWLEPAIGQGYSVADVNPGILFASQGLAPSMSMSATMVNNRPTIKVTNGRGNRYRQMLEGDGDGPVPTPGRYGEAHLRRAQGYAYPGLGIVPRAGTTYMQDNLTIYPKSKPRGAVDDNVPGIPNVNTVLGNQTREQYLQGISGDYATPGDIDSNGAVGLDLAGNPVYRQMGTVGETMDDPTELNLHRRYFVRTRLLDNNGYGRTNAGDRGFMAHKDAPFTPSEFERILRQRDPGSAALSNRMYDLTAYYDYERHTLTSEQWDVPCPHIAPTAELAGALRDLGLSLTHPSIGDLLRARFYLSHYPLPSNTTVAQFVDKSARLATMAMRSYAFDSSVGNPPASQAQFYLNRKQTRLISPDLGLGVRMDVNRPFGNGDDDNNNGVVDEPGEWAAEYVTYRLPDGTPYKLAFDGDQDGNFYTNVNANGSNKALVTEQPRQQYAKELYCLMMLLIDENYVMPLPTSFPVGSVTGVPEQLTPPTAPSGNNTLPPKYQSNLVGYAQHWLTARRIAQWAINAADFRDRDSIMSPFEFDADPFYDNDGDSNGGNAIIRFDNIAQPLSNGTWDVDGDIDISNRQGDDTNKPWRGVVWGCEYADVLLTETLAFHDRRTQNHEDDNGDETSLDNRNPDGTAITGSHRLARCRADGTPILTDTGNMTQTLAFDKHWDQARVPQGAAFIELFCTANPNNPIYPRELYYSDSVAYGSGNVTKTFLNLSKVVTESGKSYPVWRMPITQGRLLTQKTATNLSLPQNDVAARLAQNPATCSLDPADAAFSLLPWVNNTASSASDTSRRVTIERVVTFVNDNLSINATSGLNLTTTNSPLNVPAIDVYSSNTGTDVRLEPADYLVVGPYRNYDGRGNNTGVEHVTTIGRTTPTGYVLNGTTIEPQPMPNLFPQPLISLHSNGFIATSPDGSDQYPTYVGPGNPTSALGNAVTATSGRPSYRQIRPPVTYVCRTTATIGGDVPRSVGLNLSEPNNRDRPNVYKLTNNLQKPLTLTNTIFVKNNALNKLDKLYRKPEDGDPDGGDDGLVDDVPWDGFMERNDDLANITNTQLPRLEDHTTLRYKNVFLQRLADPLRGWHRYTNPYITIDWMPFDLTVMNAEPWSHEGTHLEHMREAGNIRRRNDSVYNDSTGANAHVKVRFGSRQRGAPRYPFKGNMSYCNLWAQPNYLTPARPGVPINPAIPGTGDPGGPPLDMDTRPPATTRVSEKLNDPNYYGMTPYDYGSSSSTAPATTASKLQFYYKWQDPLIHTLGYINESYHYRKRSTYGIDQTTPTNPTIGGRFDPAHLVAEPTVRPKARPGNGVPNDQSDYGWLTEIDFTSPFENVNELQYLKYIGAPWRPFNWLTWNNRPYAAAAELMLVSSSSPGRLFYEYDMRRTALPANDPSTGDATANKTPWEASRSANHYAPYYDNSTVPGYVNRAPYGHLLNFFESSSATDPTSDPLSPIAPNQDQPEDLLTVNGVQGYTASNFYRLFEFVHVPSRFSGTRHAHSNATVNGAQQFYSSVFEAPGWPFVAPFNSHPNYREPGRVNINTMPHYVDSGNADASIVWRSVINNFFPTRKYQQKTAQRPRYEIHDDDGKYRADGAYTPAARVGTSGNNFDQAAPWNPNLSNRSSYHALTASMRSDNTSYNPSVTGDLAPGAYGKYMSNMSGQQDPDTPALVSNPFRSYMGGYTTIPPVKSLVYSPNSAGSPNQRVPALSVDATLFRRRDRSWQPFNPANLADVQGYHNIDPAFDPLFALNFPRPYIAGGYDRSRPFSGYTNSMHYRWGANTVSGVPANYSNFMLIAGTGGDGINSGNVQFFDHFHSRDTDYRNTDRNPFFRYQLYTKLSNVATTRSNVYAIWVTLGYFEVERVKVTSPMTKALPTQGQFQGGDIPDAHRWPGGYRLIREMGADTGEIKRHKAFALFDRTIPVGFIRGENLNVDRAFLTRRVLY